MTKWLTRETRAHRTTRMAVLEVATLEERALLSPLAVFQPNNSTFYIQGEGARQFGQGTKFGGQPIPVSGDYLGNGKTQLAVYQPSTSTFDIQGVGTVQFGQGTRYGGNPIPIPADYLNNGKTEVAVFQPSTSTFYIQNVGAIQFGQGTLYGGNPIPVVGDFTGNGKTEIGVYQPSTSTFYIQNVGAIQFGQGTLYGGNPVPAMLNNPGTTVTPTSTLTTTATVEGKLGLNGYYVSPVNVILTATDPNYAPTDLTTYYRVDGGPWVTGNNVSLTTDGTHLVQYYSTDPGGTVEAIHDLTVSIDQTPPVLTVTASPTSLWPPNHRTVAVTVSGMASDATSGLSSLSYSVGDSEGEDDSSGTIMPNGNGTYSFVLDLTASRKGQDKQGRHYTISVVAQDLAGNISTASVVVTVPHDQGHGGGHGQGN